MNAAESAQLSIIHSQFSSELQKITYIRVILAAITTGNSSL